MAGATNVQPGVLDVPWASFEQMVKPTLLLKFVRRGDAHFREFCVSDDMEYLTWWSPNKKDQETRVALKGCNFRLGVDTPRKDQAGKYRDLAISLRSADGAKQLDLVCKDRREYKAWATGLAYLCLHGPPAGIAQWRERTSAAARASAVRRQAQGDGTGSAADPALARVASSADPPLGRSGRTLTSRKLRERIRETSDVYSWGRGGWGQLGHGTGDDRTTPGLVESLLGKGVQQVAAGADFSAAILDSGELMTWGCAHNARLGQGSTRHRTVPVAITRETNKGPLQAAFVACGAGHMVVLAEGGDLYACGDNAFGQLGVCDTAERGSLAPVWGLEKVAVLTVACGLSSTAVAAEDGRLFTFGCGDGGMLGHGDVQDSLAPREVVHLRGVSIRRVACGDHHMLAASEGGTLYSWGWNGLGCLGHGDRRSRWRPQRVEAVPSGDVLAVACGSAHSACIIRRRSEKGAADDPHSTLLYTWGDNSCGQLGLGESLLLAATPGPPWAGGGGGVASPLGGDAAASEEEGAGEFEMPGMEEAEQRAAREKEGALGDLLLPEDLVDGAEAEEDAEEEVALEPRVVHGSENAPFSVVSCGGFYTAAITAKSSLYVWGFVGDGQAGERLHMPTLASPTRVTALSDKEVRDVACGPDHICVTVATHWIRDDETTKCMLCGVAFTVMNRRHHCRNCGGIFCGRCTTHRIPLLHLGHTDPVRVCGTCHEKILTE